MQFSLPLIVLISFYRQTVLKQFLEITKLKCSYEVTKFNQFSITGINFLGSTINTLHSVVIMFRILFVLLLYC